MILEQGIRGKTGKSQLSPQRKERLTQIMASLGGFGFGPEEGGKHFARMDAIRVERQKGEQPAGFLRAEVGQTSVSESDGEVSEEFDTAVSFQVGSTPVKQAPRLPGTERNRQKKSSVLQTRKANHEDCTSERRLHFLAGTFCTRRERLLRNVNESLPEFDYTFVVSDMSYIAIRRP
jgi:hypothetical protein